MNESQSKDTGSSTWPRKFVQHIVYLVGPE